MRTLARITAVILVIVGILIILSTLSLAVIGAFRDALRLEGTLPAGRGVGLAGVLSLLFFLGYGILVMGMGQGLYLLADLASRPRLAS